MRKLQSKRHPVMLLQSAAGPDGEGSGEGGGTRRYVLDTEVDDRGPLERLPRVSILISEESVIAPGPREQIYDADRICLDIPTARWLLERLPALIEQATAIEDELYDKRVRVAKQGAA